MTEQQFSGREETIHASPTRLRVIVEVHGLWLYCLPRWSDLLVSLLGLTWHCSHDKAELNFVDLRERGFTSLVSKTMKPVSSCSNLIKSWRRSLAEL